MTLKAPVPPHVTPAPWKANLQHASYGDCETYRRAAAWLAPCADVADWGGSQGHLRSWLPSGCRYILVDGTQQASVDYLRVLTDLATYQEPSEGIALRHVLDMTEDWGTVLRNAVASFTRRLVVVTFTPDASWTHLHKVKSGWPIWHFNPDDLRDLMQPYLVREECVETTHPERVFYLERPCAS